MTATATHATPAADLERAAERATTMPAIVQSEYGEAGVLQLRDIAVPTIGDDQVLVRVRAAGIHIGDWHVMAGLPYLIRFVGFGVRTPKAKVRGMDVAGTVESVGRNVTRFQPGDEVFGTAEGSFAAFAATSADKLAHKPAGLDFEQAAALPTSGYAALQALRDEGGIQPGQRVLIIGASGGVGRYAVQIAKALGAVVTGVASTRNLEAVRALGADDVIDYTKGDLTGSGRRWDLVIDTAGHRSLGTLRRLLTESGTAVIVGAEGGGRILGGFDRQIRALMLSPLVSQRLRILTSAERAADLETLRELATTGALTPTVDRAYPLDQAADAIRYVHEGRPQGKVVVTV